MQTNFSYSKIYLFIVILVISLILFFAFRTPSKEIILTPTPSVSPVSPSDKYKDLMTAKCYNEEEIEVPCKG